MKTNTDKASRMQMGVEVIENQTGHTMYGSFNDKESAKNFANYYKRKNSKRFVTYTVTTRVY